jgi:hypothetical protein
MDNPEIHATVDPRHRTRTNITKTHHKTESKHGCPRRINSSRFLQKVEVLSVIEERKKYLLEI